MRPVGAGSCSMREGRPMNGDEIIIPAFTRKNACAWPKHEDGARAYYEKASIAFRREYPTDAHFSAYSVPSLERRLDTNAPAKLVELGHDGVKMVLLVFDIDGPKHEASAEWKEATRRKLDAFADGAFTYETRGGFRLVYTLATPFFIRCESDRQAWRATYARACVHLARVTGIVADAACADFTRLFRLPHATREKGGRPEALPRANPNTIAPWHHTPMAPHAPDDPALVADIEYANELSKSWGNGWRQAVNDLERVREDHTRRARRERHAQVGRERVRQAYENAPPPDDAADAELARELAGVAGVWVRGSIDKAGRSTVNELAVRGYEAERCASIITHAISLAGYPHDAVSMRKKAIEQATRAVAGKPSLWGVCRREFPDLYAVICERCPLPSKSPLPDEVPLENAVDAVARIERESSNALARTGSITVIRSTTGAGKSAAIRRAIAARGLPASIFVQGHDVARTYETSLTEIGVRVKRGEGVAAVRDEGGSTVCRRLDVVAALASLGEMPREVLCPSCPYREGCTAAERLRVEDALVRVDQASIAHRLIEHFTGKLKTPELDENGEEKPVTRAIVLDEPPALTDAVELTDDTDREWRRMRYDLTNDAREAIDQLVVPLLAALARVVDGAPVVRDGFSLRELLGACGYDTGIEQALVAARAVPDKPWKGSLTASLTKGTDDPERLAVVRRMVSLAEVIVEAAHRPDAPLLSIDDDGRRLLTVRARWARHVRAFADAGGAVLLLDATAHAVALSAALGEHVLVAVDVADAAGVSRELVRWSSAARGKHTIGSGEGCRPKALALRGPFRDLALKIRESGARVVGVLADKPTSTGMLAAFKSISEGSPTPELIPEELAELVRDGVVFDVGWYGNQRGSNRWQAVDLLATIGDPHPNLGAARASARALGIGPDELAAHGVDSELVQAWGRARPVHRSKPVVVIAYSNREPRRSGMAPQWHGASFRELKRGRPTTANPSADPSTWQRDRDDRGESKRRHAVSVGLVWSTYRWVESKNTDHFQGQGWAENPFKRMATDVLVSLAPQKTSSAEYLPTVDPENDRAFWGLSGEASSATREAPTATHTTEVYDAPVTNEPVELDGVQVEAVDTDLVACNIPRFAEPDDLPEDLESSIANDTPRGYWWQGRTPSPPIHQPANDPPRTLPLEQLIAVSRGGGSVRGAGVRLPGSGMAACGRSEAPRRRTWWSR